MTGRAKTQKLFNMLVSSGRLARRGVYSSERSKGVKKKEEKKEYHSSKSQNSNKY